MAIIRKTTISSPLNHVQLRQQRNRTMQSTGSGSRTGSKMVIPPPIRRLEGSQTGIPVHYRTGIHQSGNSITTLSAETAHITGGLADVDLSWSHRQLQEFANDSFNPKKYLAGHLKTLNDKDIRAVSQSLEGAKAASDMALQRNIYKTYPEFIEISKELMKLETDMFLVKDLLSEMKVIGEDLLSNASQNAPANSTETGGVALSSTAATAKLQRRRTLRSSVADQQALFHAQMTSLWNTVEDSQKFLPFHPNRHVVTEYHGLKELNPTTYQYKQTVSLILLNDSLLVAARRKRAKTAKPVLVADKCWPLNGITVVDLRDTRDLSYAFRVTRNAESYLFYCASSETKRDLLSMVKKAVGSFVDAGSTGPAGDHPGLSTPSLSSRTVFVKEEDGHLVQVLEKMCNNLDVHIAHHDFQEAVQLIVESKKLARRSANASLLVQHWHLNLQKRQADLTLWIMNDMSLPNAPKSHIIRGVGWLIQLDQTIEAKNVFLATRSATIRHRTRQLKLEGNTCLHIKELAIVFFYLIRNTCSWYTDCFQEPLMTSGLIKWVREELSVYADIFRRQVFHGLQKLEVISECLANTEQEMSVLMYSGLDLAFMLDQEFQRDLSECVKRYEGKYATQIAQAVRQDDFHHLQDGTPDNDRQDPTLNPSHWLTPSMYEFERVVTEFLDEIHQIVRETLYGQIVASTSSLVEGTLKHLLNLCRDSTEDDAKCYTIMINCRLLVNVVLPRIGNHCSVRYHRPPVDFDNLRARLNSFPLTVQEIYCHKKSQTIGQELYPFAQMDFSSASPMTDDARPTSAMVGVVQYIMALGVQLDAWPLDKKAILYTIVERFFYSLTDPAGWDVSSARRAFGFQGVQQLMLDIHFFLRVASPWVSRNASSVANKICEKALRLYFSTHRKRDQEMKGIPWYDARVADTVAEFGPGFPDFGRRPSSQRI
ncbi:exocyst complex component exo84 [Dispira simplex]|nr:exocyst complex component exo84 [Dispira simplex]